MNPSTFYAELVDRITDHDLRIAARQLSYHVGEANRISIEDLAREVYGPFDKTGKYEAKEVRDTRKLLQTLREEYGYPVCSSSSVKGRWMPAFEIEGVETAEELEQKADKLKKSARQIRENSKRLPARPPNIGTPKGQQSLFQESRP